MIEDIERKCQNETHARMSNWQAQNYLYLLLQVCFFPCLVFTQFRFFSSLKGKYDSIMQLHLTTTPLKSEMLCCALSVNNHFSCNSLPSSSSSSMHTEGHNSRRLPWNSVINVFSVRVRIHHGLRHCIQHGLADWVGGPAGPQRIKMVQIQCWAACTELQWAPWSLEHFVSACIQPIICNRSIAKGKTHMRTQRHTHDRVWV